jgi:acetate kinase
MFFTPVDRLMMGTRAGALDPRVILYLLQHEEMNAAAIKTLIYERSGLLGVTGLLSDRALLASERPAAKEAIDLFVYRIRRELGSLAGALGGLDALVFTGGIGEHAVEIRARCAATRNGSGSGSTKWPMPPADRVSQGPAQRFQCGSCRPMRT